MTTSYTEISYKEKKTEMMASHYGRSMRIEKEVRSMGAFVGSAQLFSDKVKTKLKGTWLLSYPAHGILSRALDKEGNY